MHPSLTLPVNKQETLLAAMPAPSLQGLSVHENLMLGTNGAVHLMLPSSGRLSDQCFRQGAQGWTDCCSSEEAHWFIQDINITECVLNQCSD